VDLLVVQLKAAIRRLLDTKGVRGRVLDKVNRYGEIVIGVILERPAPPPHGALPPEDASDRPQRERPPSVIGPPRAATISRAIHRPTPRPSSAAHEERDRQLREELGRGEAVALDDVRRAGERIAPFTARDR
jgi:hypothetical protein